MRARVNYTCRKLWKYADVVVQEAHSTLIKHMSVKRFLLPHTTTTVTETVGDSDDELQAEAERLREEAFQLKLQHQLQQKHLLHQAQLQLLQLGLKDCTRKHIDDLLPEVQPVAVGSLKSRSMVATLGVFKARKVSTAS
jgi:hypothetical protein